jgi:hypothetical protein
MSGKLYDAESMMLIERNVANGFVVLLNNGSTNGGSSGGKEKKKTKSETQEDNSLAFMALTSGNVLDACFGVQQAGKRGEDTPAKRKAQDAKNMLDAAASTEAFCNLAVEAYRDAFEIVVEYNDDMNQLNCITKCFQAGKLRTNTEEKLEKAFANLAQAIAARH